MKPNLLIVILIFLIFFVISFLSNILGPLIPDIIDSFRLSIGLAGFLPFSFFVAYGIMSIPAGILIEKYSNKTVIIAGFLSSFVAALIFAIFPTFEISMISLFSIGIGMAMLQVVINPLLRKAGGEANFAFNSVMAQLFFGLASFVSPWLYSFLVGNIHTDNRSPVILLFNNLVPPNIKWVSLYWVFAVTSLIMVLIISFVKFPKVELKEDERIGKEGAFIDLMKNKYVWLFFIGIFAYVGTEQGIANWASKFLQYYHDIDPATTGAKVISYFWGLMTVGCVAGLFILKLFDSRYVLVVSAGCAIIALGFALFGSLQSALISFPLTGFFLSVMWSIIISLGLNSVPRHHGTFSGILCTAIAGGAVIPLMIGGLAELIGLKFGMGLLFFSLGYVLSVGIWAKPLVNNSIIKNWKRILKV